MRRFLLCEVVQAYLPLEGPQLEEFNHLLVTEKYAEVLPMATTWYEQGQFNLVRKQLEKRFGQLPPRVLARLEALPPERLEELSLALLDARSLDELGLDTDRPA